MAMYNPTAARKGVLADRTSSKLVKGLHRFEIKGYSLTKGMGIGKFITSDTFTVGGHEWAIHFYPDGIDPKDKSTFVSVFVALNSMATNLPVLFEFTLLNQNTKVEHKLHSHFDRNLLNRPYTLENIGNMWGFKQFYNRRQLETSNFLKDDCLKINCTVGVFVSSLDSSKLYTTQVPESDMGANFGRLLDNGKFSDVTFSVGGERFHAHKLVLIARSNIFRLEFLVGMEKDDHGDIVVNDMEPKVFKALLHFIYRDTLIEDEELHMPCSLFLPSLSESFPAKLLAAAEKYWLPRLKLMCESILCKDLSTDSVAYILPLADRYGTIQLKSNCLKFSAQHLHAVMQSDGFKDLKQNYPLLQLDLLKTVAGYLEKSREKRKIATVSSLSSDADDTDDRSVNKPGKMEP